jgi:hypothetical protein
MQTVLVYGYVVDGIVTAIGEVGISGSRSSPTLLSPARRSIRGAQRQQPIFTGIVVFNFKFQYIPTELKNSVDHPVQFQKLFE